MVTSYCAVKIVSASAERVGQGEVGGVTRRVTCTWWLLASAAKAPWLGPGESILTLAAWTGLENATLGGSFLVEKPAWALSGCLTTKSADYCMLVNEWLRSRVCLLRLEVELGAGLESELGQKWSVKGMYRLKVQSIAAAFEISVNPYVCNRPPSAQVIAQLWLRHCTS